MHPPPSKCCVGRGSGTQWKKFGISILRLRIYKICSMMWWYTLFFFHVPLHRRGGGSRRQKKIYIWYFHSEPKYLKIFYQSRKVFWNIFHAYLLMGGGKGQSKIASLKPHFFLFLTCQYHCPLPRESHLKYRLTSMLILSILNGTPLDS